MTYNVKQIESLVRGRDWYEVVEADNEYHLWIVEHDPLTDKLDCTCDAAEWCSHRKAAADEIAAVDARMNRQDALDYARGQF